MPGWRSWAVILLSFLLNSTGGHAHSAHGSYPWTDVPVIDLFRTEGLTSQAILQHHNFSGDPREVAVASSSALPGRATPVLAYVTPWNGAGYDHAKKYRCRLDYVVPVWFQLRAAGGRVQLTGGHDVDAGWVAALRQPCEDSHRARVLPRLIFEMSGQDALLAFRQPDDVAELLAEVAERHAFDGWVFEGWSHWAAAGITAHSWLRSAALHLLSALHAELAPAGRKLVLAVSPLVPAPGRPAQLEERDAEELLNFVDGLSVMTYDHASAQQPGPNAPLGWWERNADAFAAVADRLPGKPRHKVMLGLPFYGYEYRWSGGQVRGVDAVVAGRLLEVLHQQQQQQQQQQQHEGSAAEGDDGLSDEERQLCSSGGGGAVSGVCDAARVPQRSDGGSSGGSSLSIEWLEGAAEHLVTWQEPWAGSGDSTTENGSKSTKTKKVGKKKKAKAVEHWLYFPTPAMLAARLAAAQSRGMGAAVWELGQGLEAFCTLL